MAKYILDNEGAEIMRLSNDAFLYLTQEEEPLDEDNLIEAQQLYEEFPLGFEIVDYRYVDNGEVIVKIIPYKEVPVIIKPKKQKADLEVVFTGPAPQIISNLIQDIKNTFNCYVYAYFDKIWWTICIDNYELYMDSTEFEQKKNYWWSLAQQENIPITFSYCKPVKSKLTKLVNKGLLIA